MADIKILDLTTATEITETTDYIPVVDTSDTTQDSTGTTKKATVRKLLGDRVLPDTIVGTTETQTLTNKTLTSPVINTPTGDVVTPSGTQTLTNKTLSTGSVIDANVNVVEVLKKAYPIGSVYINASNATNPASLLGFGTWSAFGAGKVMVGLDAGDTSFDTAGETGGEKTHTLTIAEMPSHDHAITAAGNELHLANGSSGIGLTYGDSNGGSTVVISSKGSGSAHNNLQPYIVFNYIIKT